MGLNWLSTEVVEWEESDDYQMFVEFVRGLTVVNDPSERSAQLAKHFVMRSRSEEFLQENFISVCDHRKRFAADRSGKLPKNVLKRLGGEQVGTASSASPSTDAAAAALHQYVLPAGGEQPGQERVGVPRSATAAGEAAVPARPSRRQLNAAGNVAAATGCDDGRLPGGQRGRRCRRGSD